MRGKALAFLAKAARPNGAAMVALAFLVVSVVLASSAAAPYLFKGATLDGEVAAQLRATMGLRVLSSDSARFGLLPSPHIEVTRLSLADPDGALAIDAGALDGEVRLLPLIVGRLELASVTLSRPKLTIDLDAGAMPADSAIGRALHGLAATPGDASQRLGSVTLIDASAVLTSKTHAGALPKLDEINVTIDWPDIGSPATLTGSLMVDDIATDVAAWIAQPSSLMRGDASPIAVRIHSAPLDLSANGDLSSADASVFHGHMSVSAPSLPALLALAGNPARLVAPFANIALNSDATITVDRGGGTVVDLPGLGLDLDGNRYEGTLAYERGAKHSLSGTLATETLSLAPFLASEPSLADDRHRWTRTALSAGGDLVDLDLRISATHLRVATFTIDDAALSVMTRGARTEIALSDGKAYGGAIKGRASIGIANGVLSLRGAGTLADADLAGLSWDALGRQVAAGTLSCSANIDTAGDSPAALMAHLQGWAKGRARDGEVSGLDLGRGLRDLDAKRTDAGLAAMRRGRTPFSSLAFAVRLADGVATVEDATMAGPDATAAVTGSADIGNRGLDLSATASPPQDTAKPAGTHLAVGIKGSFDTPVFAPHLQAAVSPLRAPRQAQ